MNSKGQSYEMVVWIPRLVYLIIVIVSSLGLIFAFTVTNVNVGDIESHILLHRLHFSPDGLSKYDSQTGRVYSGVIDKGRFSPEAINKFLAADEGVVAARFVKMPLDESSEEVAYLNHETYTDWQPIAITVLDGDIKEGTGRKFPYRESRYVYDGLPSKLETVVIMPDE